VALAWLTTKFIERPLRFSKSPAMAPALFAAMLAIGVTGYLTFATGGLEGYGFRSADKTAFAQHFENSLPDWHYFESAGIPEKYRFDCDFNDPSYRYGRPTEAPKAEIAGSCYERDASRSKVLFIWGDSHAQMLYWGLKNNLPPNWQVMIVASVGCNPDASATEDSTTHYCQRSNWFALNQLRLTKPDAVIVTQRSERDTRTLEAIEKVLAEDGVGNILLLGPTPQWAGSLPKIIMREFWDHTPARILARLDESVIAENQRIGANLSLVRNAQYVDLYKFFCDETGCLTRIGDDRLAGSVTFDYGHLTPIASDYLARNLLANLVTGATLSAR
jgi:hypothetical protein